MELPKPRLAGQDAEGDRGQRVEVLREAMARTEGMLQRGVRMRTLYQHTAQYSPNTTAYVEIVSNLGAEVRTLGEGFMRMLAFDGEIVVIEPKGTPRPHWWSGSPTWSPSQWPPSS
jgi:hypothetical protein